MAEPGKYLIGESLREKLKSTISKVDSLAFGGPVSRIPTVLEDGGSSFSPKIFRVGTVTTAWSMGSSQAVTYYGVTSTPNTVSVINQLVSLPAPKSTATSRIVNVAKDGTQWYLVSFQMSAKTAVMATATQTITFLGPNSTQTITYAEPGSSVSVITNISATLNTTDCSITVNKTTTNVTTVGASHTATAVSLAGTQTATVVSGTFTATFISLEI
jgi:hypothetical protein